jgi:hypothetical protein
MKLSQLNVTPKYNTSLPSTKKKITYRPFLVKEEKALLAAQESESISVMLETLKQVVEGCVEPDGVLENMTSFDLEYLFTLIRSKSVGEYSDLILPCGHCNLQNNKTKVRVDLRTVEVKQDKTISNKVKISDTVAVTLKYPSLSDLIEVQSKPESDVEFYTIMKSIETIYAEDDVYHAHEEEESELMAFINHLTSKQYSEIKEYIQTAPSAQIKVKYTCPACKAENERVLKGLNSFF